MAVEFDMGKVLAAVDCGDVVVVVVAGDVAASANSRPTLQSVTKKNEIKFYTLIYINVFS